MDLTKLAENDQGAKCFPCVQFLFSFLHFNPPTSFVVVYQYKVASSVPERFLSALLSFINIKWLVLYRKGSFLNQIFRMLFCFTGTCFKGYNYVVLLSFSLLFLYADKVLGCVLISSLGAFISCKNVQEINPFLTT